MIQKLFGTSAVAKALSSSNEINLKSLWQRLLHIQTQ